VRAGTSDRRGEQMDAVKESRPRMAERTHG
jgi:hypothetical protein